MEIAPTTLPDLMFVLSDPARDHRGAFHSLFEAEAFAAAGIEFTPRQSGLSSNLKAGTLRGLHYQKAPARQAKLVRCIRGRILDVVVDLRPQSPAFGRWLGVELDEASGRALYIPDGFAHGFMTLTDGAEVLYELSACEIPGAAAGIRWNDPHFAIDWPREPAVMNDRDRQWPDWVG